MAKKRGGTEPEGVGEAAATPKRRGRPKSSAEGPKGNVLSIRGSEEWRDWVGRLADHSRLKVADVIDRALLAYAKQEGFTEPARLCPPIDARTEIPHPARKFSGRLLLSKSGEGAGREQRGARGGRRHN